MGKSKSAKQDVTNYYMSLHFGATCGPTDAILGLYANEKPMWEGNLTTEGEISINQPELFGGIKKEGGTVGSAYYLPGGSTQVMPEALAAKLGRTTATCPAYRGVSTVFFYGGSTQLYNPLLPFYFTTAGFLWSSNNPIIAQSVWAKLRRAPKGLDPAKAMIGPDANPAHMIFECLTNTDWGLGLSSSLIDGASFSAVADTLYNEEFGLSMIWTQQAQVEDFISEILDHIQATYYINPRTGLYTLKLIRDDYDPSELRVMNPDNAKVTSFQRKMWGETANEIVVTWTNPINEQEETVSVQNLAVVSAQGGPIPDSRNYYGVRNKELAVRLANRDLVVSSAPLATVEVELDRTAWDLLPGEVVKLTWPEYDLDQLIMRVGTVDYGKIGDPTIRATLIEDVFSLEKPTDVSSPGTDWTRPGEPPAPMAHVKILTLPYFFVSSTDLQAGVLDLAYPSEVVAMVLAHQTGYDTPAYELLSEQVSTTGTTSYQSAGTKVTLDRITLSNSMVAAVQSTLLGQDVADVIIGPQVGGFVFIGDTNDAGMEIALVDSYDGLDWILARGVLDTVPRAWPAGTPMWFVNSGSRIVDDQTVRAPGESPDYKLLSRTSLGILAETDAPIVTGTLTARPHLPLRPANVKVNGVGFESVAIGGSANVTITWGTRNRQLEDGQVVRWNASTVAPEYAQETVVSIYDQVGVLVYEQGSLWTETSLVLPKTNFDRYPSITVLVRSRRDGLWSLQGHSIQVTGLANNPAAPLPPTPPPPTPPPTPTGAPATGAFAVTGTAVTSASGASTPTVLVVGTPDNANATGLVVRYRKTGSSDYTYWPTVDLRPGVQVRFAIAPLAALTDYVFEAAYEVGNNPLGAWVTLLPNPVTTGSFVSDNAVNVGTRTALQLLADVDQALADAAAALAAAGGEAADLAAAIAAATAARDAAIAAQENAEDAAVSADGSATSAGGSATLAQSKAADAAASATAAFNSASSASGYAASASSYSTAAATSASAAAATAASLTASLSPKSNLILNGTFAQPFSLGWNGGNANWAVASEATVGTFAQTVASGDQYLVSNVYPLYPGAQISVSFNGNGSGASGMAVDFVNAAGTAIIGGQGFATATPDWTVRRSGPLATAPSGTAGFKVFAYKSAATSYFGVSHVKVNVGPPAAWSDELTAGTNAVNAFAAISTEAAVRASETSALASTTTALTATVNGHTTTLAGNAAAISANTAAISAEASTRASQTAALAATDTTLTSTVNGHTATLTIQAATIADLTGKLYSRWMMEATAGGVVTGIYGIASQGASGIPLSGIKFRANTFAIVPSDDSATLYPFIYDATLGILVANQLIVQSANIGALAVKTLNLDGFAVTTEKLQAKAVTNSVNVVTNAAVNFNVSAETTLISLNIAVAEAASRVEVYLFIIQSAASTSLFDLKVYRDGTLLTTISNYGSTTPIFGMPVVDFPGSGNHTYEVRTLRTSSGGGSNNTSYRYMTITEFKR